MALEEVAQEVANQTPVDDNLTAQDAVNRDFDRAIAPSVVDSLADDSDYRDEAAAPSSSIADEGYGSDAEWAGEPAAESVAAEDAAPLDSADPYDDKLVETYPAIDTHADDVVAVESSHIDRQTLLSLADLLDRLGMPCNPPRAN